MLDFVGVLWIPKGNPHGVGYLSYSQASGVIHREGIT